MTDPATDVSNATASERPMAPWWPLLGGIALIALAYVGDRLIGAVLELILAGPDALTQPDLAPWVAVEMAARVVATGLLAGLGWLVLRGPRRRLTGVAMLAVGLYFPLATLIYIATFDTARVALPLLPINVGWDDGVAWTSAGVIVLGAIVVIWPTPKQPPDR